MKKLLLLSLLGLGSFYNANAQDADSTKVAPPIVEDVSDYKPVRFLLGAAFEFGGDEVGTVTFTNGDEQSINAGQGIAIAVGAEFQFRKLEQLRLRATIGYKYVTTAADNAHIRLTRVPLHLTANWMATEKIRLGAGVVKHQAIKLNTDGLSENMEFDGSTGAIFEFAYSGFGISYTIMEYTDQANNSYAANAIGFTISGVLPKRK
ncbi:hypothetical protein KB205_17735 [Microvirga sp. STS03]|uniref:hypothetical protein n=1 Tax=Pontibacter TaxID=323449 RepID=UPI001B81518C|nr:MULTISPECIES: hypothetical protein [Pontibacter]MBR0572481.1 hypothetical protein [Microvirga sp. STS03]